MLGNFFFCLFELVVESVEVVFVVNCCLVFLSDIVLCIGEFVWGLYCLISVVEFVIYFDKDILVFYVWLCVSVFFRLVNFVLG